MKRNKDIMTYIESLDIPEGSTYRGTCPTCRSRGTFTVARINRKLVYNCYRNSCPTRGAQHRDASINSVKTYLNTHTVSGVEEVKLPPHIVQGVQTEAGRRFLQRTGAYPAYRDGLFRVYTDIIEQRLVIPLHDIDGTLVNLGGRSLVGAQPKFKVYYRKNPIPPFIVGSGYRVVIVEDFASAACVAQLPFTVGFALLGTNFEVDKHIAHLKALNPVEIMVALDRDATKKAVALQKLLTFFFDCAKVIPLTKDIKDMTEEELKLWYTERLECV